MKVLIFELCSSIFYQKSYRFRCNFPNQFFKFCQQGNLEIAERLLDAKADLAAVDSRRRINLFCSSRLFFTISMRKSRFEHVFDVKITFCFIENQKFEIGTPLLLAARDGHAAVARCMLMKGADVHAVFFKIYKILLKLCTIQRKIYKFDEFCLTFFPIFCQNRFPSMAARRCTWPHHAVKTASCRC